MGDNQYFANLKWAGLCSLEDLEKFSQPIRKSQISNSEEIIGLTDQLNSGLLSDFKNCKSSSLIDGLSQYYSITLDAYEESELEDLIEYPRTQPTNHCIADKALKCRYILQVLLLASGHTISHLREYHH